MASGQIYESRPLQSEPVGFVETPLHIELVNMIADLLETFEDLLTALDNPDDELERYTFTDYLEHYEDDQDSE